MKKAVFLQKEFTNFLVINSCPGVFGFINFIEKLAWMSYSENVSEALIRNIKLIDSRQHIIKNLDTWDICVFEKSDSKQIAKSNYKIYCQNYRSKGIKILSREMKYKVWGKIEPDFRDSTRFLYYIWMGTKKQKKAVLGVFESAREGELFLKGFKSGQATEFPPSSKRLVIEFKKIDQAKLEFDRMFKNETL